MEERFAIRLQEMMSQAELSAVALNGLLEQLEEFVRPYGETLSEVQQRHAREYVSGLVSKLEKKTGEAIAYLHDQDRQPLQIFIGQDDWDHQPLVDLLARQIGNDIGKTDGVLVFDPSGFGKKGKSSVGVARQWCGRLGKVENCQVGIYLGYVSRQDHALVDVRLYLPKEWTGDRARCQKAGVPRGTRFCTRHELALEMLDRHGSALPHTWVAGDDEMGRPAGFRAQLQARGERYLLAVPSNTLIRDLQTEPPVYRGRGRRPERPFQRADRWLTALPATAWTRIDVRDGEKGPLVIEAVQRCVQARSGRQVGPTETLFVTRELQADGSYKHDYYLSNDTTGASNEEFARVAKAEHCIESAIKRGKSEAGLGDYQVRNWIGWHHHQILSLIAAWFLNGATRRGKNPDARADGATSAEHDRQPARRTPAQQHASHHPASNDALATPQRTGTLLPSSCA
ncbi:MAG: IS701 family transposase [Lysobacterales bacterium]